jgi:hypothetical protein
MVVEHRSMKGRKHLINEQIAKHRRAAQRGYEALVAAGELKPLAEWDLEELSRGRPRNRGGGFQGSTPKWLAQAVQEEISRRYKQKAIIELSKHFPKALKVLIGLLDEEDPGIRLKACQLLIEYTVGKPNSKLEVTADSKAAGMLASALVLPGGRPAHPVTGETIEGEWTEKDD